MKKYIFITVLSVSLFAFRFEISEKNDPVKINSAIEKSLVLLQSSSHTFIENAGCWSCHGQALGAVTFSMARKKGFTVNDSLFRETFQMMLDYTYQNPNRLLENFENPGGSISAGYSLWALSAAECKPDKATTLIAHKLLQRQTSGGDWVGGNGRAPLEYYSFTTTALVAKGLQDYASLANRERVNRMNEKAREWMLKTLPVNNEEKAFQLLGLAWTNTDQKIINHQAAILLSNQQADGGWSQLDSLPTDAYATGQSLFALNQSGFLHVNDSSFQNGIAYLLRTQHEDGSWRIISRSHPFLTYVSSGFPHGSDQFISAAGSNWATIALLQTINK